MGYRKETLLWNIGKKTNPVIKGLKVNNETNLFLSQVVIISLSLLVFFKFRES